MFVNQEQSKKERRSKYRIARSYGLDPATARVLRDWKSNHFKKFIMNYLKIKKKEEEKKGGI